MKRSWDFVVSRITLLVVLSLWTRSEMSEAAPVTTVQPITAAPREVLDLSLTYFAKYGYISPDDIQPGKTPNETIDSDFFQRAVRTLQTYANIEVTGVVDEETQAVLVQPRCGNDDPSLPDSEIGLAATTLAGSAADASGPSVRVRRYNVAGGNYKWNRDTLYYWIKSFPGPKSNLSEYIVRYDVRQAFQLWSDVTPLVFIELHSDSSQVDIEISFGGRVHTSVSGDPAFDGPGGTLAHAFTPNSGWGKTNGDVHFDDDETFTHKQYKGVNLFYTAAHEIGHALGLDHSNARESLMWPWDKGYIPNFKLPLDDKKGIQAIYGKNPIAVSTPPPPTTPAPPTTRPPVIIPPYCNTSLDAAADIRGTLMIFKKDRLWRFRPRYNSNGQPDGTFPLIAVDLDQGVPVDQFFVGVRKGMKAVYERQDGRIVFLKARKKWIFDGTRLESGPVVAGSEAKGYPRTVYAALFDHDTGLTYLFKGRKVWLYDEFSGNTNQTTLERLFRKGLHPTVRVDSAFSFYHQKFLLDGPHYFTADENNFVPNHGKRNFGVDILGCPTSKYP